MKSLLLVLTVSLCQYVSAVDLYWVNGSGNWNDPTHWSLTSNGSGGAGIPGPKDNVHFDQHSFINNGSININTDVTFASFDASQLTQKVEFNANAPRTITVGGSFELSAKSLFRIPGLLLFNSNRKNNIINGGDQQLLSDVRFDGKGSWKLNNNLGLLENATLDLVRGDLDLNGFSLYLGALKSDGTEKKSLDIEGSTIYVHESWKLDNLNAFKDGGETIFLSQDIPLHEVVKGPSSNSSFVLKAITCANQIDVTITVTSDYNGQDISCNGVCDAEITVVGSSPLADHMGMIFRQVEFSQVRRFTPDCVRVTTRLLCVILLNKSSQVFISNVQITLT